QTSGQEGEKETQAEAKKKRNKKKGGASAKLPKESEKPEREPSKLEKPSEPPSKAESAEKSDAGPREEFEDAVQSPSRSKAKREARPEKVLAGTELLQELQSLRSHTEALEARMAERLQARAVVEEEEEEEGAKPNPARRRKKMFARVTPKSALNSGAERKSQSRSLRRVVTRSSELLSLRKTSQRDQARLGSYPVPPEAEFEMFAYIWWCNRFQAGLMVRVVPGGEIKQTFSHLQQKIMWQWFWNAPGRWYWRLSAWVCSSASETHVH
ncbi:unnamed protein product, partial [Effrenium voratum]